MNIENSIFKAETLKLSLLIILITGIFILLYGCIEPSRDEVALYDSLKSKYDCEIDIRKGISNASGEDEKIYFQISILNCKQIDNSDFEASVIALEAFKTIAEKNITHINVEISDDLYSFQLSDLKQVEKAESYYYEIFESIKNNQFDVLYRDLWENVKKDITLSKFTSSLQTISSGMEFINLKIDGFKLINERINGTDLEAILIEGSFGKDKKKRNTFKLYVPNEFKKKIYGIDIYSK